MKKAYIFGAAVISGMVVASAVATPVFAWHPKGQIKKYVQNVTAQGVVSDANDVKSAVSAKPGDTLKYVIEITNTGTADSRGYNDMHFTVLKDTLPQGVELVSNPATRELTENLGVVKPGQKVTREFIVRVTSKQDKAVVTNTACFTGDSEVKDAPQKGCDPAVITVTVPPVEPPKQPEPPVEKPQVKAAQTPTELPKTGIGSVAGIFTGVSGLGYVAHRAINRKRY